ncbi:hypothetical protein C3943_21630 [Lysinibacillus sp. B2A1]|nr:hypothetical protein C3943_21630 [Lysinibacillus sp. B2A1]
MRQTLVPFAIVVLLIQTVFGSLPALATSDLKVTMTSNGQPYIEGESAQSPVEVQVTTTSADSANVEFSQNGTTWQPFNVAKPFIVEKAGEHFLWFRLAGTNEQKYTIRIAPPLLQTTIANHVIYVREGAAGQRDGTSWEDAFDNLQSALEVAQSGQQIWLATGTYKPTAKIDPADDRSATFQLKNNVAIYGGFNGTEADLVERDCKANPTILSGDISVKDDYTDNTYHVFYHPASLQLDETAILDGVTIKDGNANNGALHNLGGGMFNDGSSPKLVNVTFSTNRAEGGGGMTNMNSSDPTLVNVEFQANEAQIGGGMVNVGGSSPALLNVKFTTNTAQLYGGGMGNIGGSNPNLTNVEFLANVAQQAGGGIVNADSSPILTNVTISGNKSEDRSGQGIRGAIYGESGVIRNSIIVDNHNEPALSDYTGKIESSLLDVEENGAVLAKFHKTKTNIETNIYKYEDIFIDPSKSNYRLKAKSPVIDKGDNKYNSSPTDLAGNARIQGGTIDLGAYEAGFYTVTYDKNGATDGDVPEDIGIYEENNLVTVQNNSGILVKPGYIFAGWNLQADGKGTHYAENSTFLMGTANVTLYAQWTKNPTYAVQYDANGATGGQVPNSNQYEENEIVTVQENNGKLVRTGHTFKGWNLQADGAGIAYMPNDTFKMGKANVTLYAQWTTNPTYQVQYNANGATGGQVPNSRQFEENETVSVQENRGQLVRIGYTFKGWNTQADGKGTYYAEKATFPMGKVNITLYAQWTANPPTTGGNTTPPSAPSNNDAPLTSNGNDFSLLAPVKITFHTNGGTVSDLPVPTRAGYRFVGWYQDKALTEQWAGEALEKENLVLYAKWIPLQVEEPPKEPYQPKPSVVTFDDIRQHWAKDLIEELATQGIIRGFEDGTFRPDESISRMHVAALLAKAFSFEAVRTADDFSDVPPTHPYYNAIQALQQAGIVDGSNGAFLPTENMTRAQLAKVLVGVLGLKPEGTSSFTDVDSTHWSTGYIAVLEREKIALGDNGYFHPNTPVTRAQFVAFLHRIISSKNSNLR